MTSKLEQIEIWYRPEGPGTPGGTPGGTSGGPRGTLRHY